MVSIAKVLIAVIMSSATIAFGQARVWQDPSGRYQVEGTLVTSDDSLIVIKNAEGELVVLRREQLSTADREFLNTTAGASSIKLEAKPAVPPQLPNEAQPPDAQPNDSQPDNPSEAPASSVNEEQSSVNPAPSPALPTELSTWHLRHGKPVQGKLIGFGRQDFVILRREGELWINAMNVKALPSAYEWIVPAVVTAIDGKPIGDIKELEKHIAAGGGGPFEYVVAGVQLELEEGGVITIPLTLLEPALAAQVEPGFARWQAAQGDGVGEEDRYHTSRRERLFLDSYERLRRTENAQARKLKLMELELLSVNAGLTEIWEVGLVPTTPYAFPRSVVVPGRDSLDAQQIAAQAYPGWQIGPVRKLSD